MSKLYTITFIEEEKYCRVEGELCTDEWWEAKCGIDGEVDITENYIMKDDILYLKKKDVYSILEAVGQYYAPDKEYDFIFNKGYGSEQAHTRKSILGKNGAFVVSNPDYLKSVQIKDYKEFKKNYPLFNKKEYIKLINSLDAYYDNLKTDLKRKEGKL